LGLSLIAPASTALKRRSRSVFMAFPIARRLRNRPPRHFFYFSMFNPIFLAFIVFYAVLCSVEFIVFNEEVLLALCFFSFIFFCFNLLSDSTAENLNSRANKFEAEFLSLF